MKIILVSHVGKGGMPILNRITITSTVFMGKGKGCTVIIFFLGGDARKAVKRLEEERIIKEGGKEQRGSIL